MRDVDGRIRWALNNKPAAANRCAEHLWHALGGPADPPRQGLPDATSVANLVRELGHMQTGPCPRGAIRYWVGGSQGHGHVAIETADLLEKARVVSVDVKGPGTVGEVSLDWIANNWPKLRYVGWSWYWGRFDTEPKPTKPEPEPPHVEAAPTPAHRDWTGKVTERAALTVDGAWRPFPGLRELRGSPFTSPDELHTLYCRLHLTWQASSTPLSVECRWMRSNGDATGHDEDQWQAGPGMESILLRPSPHDEIGQKGIGGHWEYRLSGQGVRVEAGTRYAKLRSIDVVWVD